MYIWDIVKDFINEHPIGSEMTRKRLLYRVKFIRKNKPFQETTVDYFRNMLEKLGYLEKGDKRGVYIVRHHIDRLETVSGIRKAYEEIISNYDYL